MSNFIIKSMILRSLHTLRFEFWWCLFESLSSCSSHLRSLHVLAGTLLVFLFFFILVGHFNCVIVPWIFSPPSGWVHRLVRLRSLHYWGIIHSIFFCRSFLPFQLRWLLKHECYISLLAYISITPLLFLNAHIRFWGLSSFSFCSKSGAISTRSSADDALETLLLSLASLISLLVSSGLNE